MNMTSKFGLAGLMIGAASLMLSTSIWANSNGDWFSMDTWTDTMDSNMQQMNDMQKEVIGWQMMQGADYMVTDNITHQVKFLDGVDKGHKVADDGVHRHKWDCMKGDHITNLHTHKSGMITGVKHKGTVDVMKPSGHSVRYQYVIFKVKPTK